MRSRRTPGIHPGGDGQANEQADHDDGNGADDVVPEEGDCVVLGTQVTEAMPTISPMRTPIAGGARASDRQDQGSPMNPWLKHWLSVFGPAAVLALLFAGPAAVEHGWDQPIRLGRVTVGILPGGWLIFALIFTLIVYRHPAGEPQRMRDWLVAFGAAALFGLLAVGPFAFMEVYNKPGIRSGEFAFPYALFHAMWLFPTMLFLAATPIVRGVRAGESVMAHPIALGLRIAFLTLVAAGWLFMLWDQMPCFLGGVPGCD